MVYSRGGPFTDGIVLTDADMDQIDENLISHEHGVGSISPITHIGRIVSNVPVVNDGDNVTDVASFTVSSGGIQPGAVGPGRFRGIRWVGHFRYDGWTGQTLRVWLQYGVRSLASVSEVLGVIPLDGPNSLRQSGQMEAFLFPYTGQNNERGVLMASCLPNADDVQIRAEQTSQDHQKDLAFTIRMQRVSGSALVKCEYWYAENI